MSTKIIYDFKDYKAFLNHVLPTSGAQRGIRSKLAAALGCQTAFISQVLNSHTHFSFEHAAVVCEFLSLAPEEQHYFMLLVSLGRAGNRKLQSYYDDQIARILEERQKVKNWMPSEREITPEDQMTYYGQWYYAAIHILLSIPKFQSRTAIANFLKLPPPLVNEVIDFLTHIGLAQTGNHGQPVIGSARIHLDGDSPMISKHHTNWRMRAIDALDRRQKNDLHYSAVISLSQADAATIRAILLKAIEETEPVLRESAEEEAFCMNVDFFKLGLD